MKEIYDILVIDDEDIVLSSVIKVGTAEGFMVDKAKTAIDALHKLRRNKYRMIICDIMIPGTDGFQFLEEKKIIKDETPVIMTSGYSTIDHAIRALSEGAIGFLPKPFTADELISRIIRGINCAELLHEQRKNGMDPKGVFQPCPKDFFRLGNASWICKEVVGSVKIGVCDLFLKTIGVIEKIELLKLGEQMVQGRVCARFDTENELVHNLLAPISGNIVARNEKILKNFDVLTRDAYNEGWLYQVFPGNLAEEIKILKTDPPY